MTRLALLVLIAATAAACGGYSPTAPDPQPTPPPVPAARYRVTFDSTWGAAGHPSEAPAVPHFSRLIGGTHRDAVRFWEAGALASEGIRLMAEEGRISPLDTEIQAAITAGTAERVFSGGPIEVSPGSVSLEFDISRGFPLVTLVSMVAPSPDWFVGVSALDLREANGWVAERVVALQPWDAGTDSGVTFTSANRATNPREPIALIAQGPLAAGGRAAALGTFTFRRLTP